MKRIILLLTVLSMFFASTVFAQTPAPPPASGPAPAPIVGTAGPVVEPSLPQFSITISPVMLYFPILEVTAEMRINPKMGVAGILGGGQITVEDSWGDDVTFSAFIVGAQFKYYVTGNFRSGLHVGAEGQYLYVSGEKDEISGSGAGMTLGGFVGYKHTFGFGLTLEAQIGYQVMAVSAEASDNDGNTGSDSDSDGGVLLNLNAGWSF